MRWSNYLLPTLKEVPADAQIASHRLMIRAGLIRKEASGIYSYLPAGFKVLRKIENIVQEEMDKSGALRVLLPIITHSSFWEKSGRWQSMGKEMMRVRDRHENDYALGPTHEESMTNMVDQTTFSYRDLPLNLYQIQSKFRDEIRPRYGVMRSREFIMKDAYSFDIDEEGLDVHYQKMRVTYRNIFKRVGLDTLPVQADVGAMGGSASEEFMILSEIGEETIIHCPACNYIANQEEARRQPFEQIAVHDNSGNSMESMEKVHTPDVKTIDQLMEFFAIKPESFLKAVVYIADGEVVTIFIRGDLEINEIKVKNFLGAVELDMAGDDAIRNDLGMEPGFIGPVSHPGKMIFDTSVISMTDLVCGAGDQDFHLKGVQIGRDFQIKESVDLHLVKQNDPCPLCAKPLIEKQGIELGHIFKLGKKYTGSMDVRVLDPAGKEVTPLMGCYGIGVNRTMAAVIEQHHDEDGILWPISVSPFQIGIISFAKKDEEKSSADDIYESLLESGFEVLYDDRDLSPGIKFKDMDLVGLPIKIILGKGFFQNGEIEIKLYHSKEKISCERQELNIKITEIIEKLNGELKI